MQLYYGLNVVRPAVALALTSTELTRSIRLPTSGDTQIDELTENAHEATAYIEEMTGHVAMPTQYKMSISRFPVLRGQPIGRLMIANGPIYLPRNPVLTVDEVTYVDVNGDEQTLDENAYQLRLATMPAVVAPTRLTFWPITDPWTISCVNITFTAGYAVPLVDPETVDLWFDDSETEVIAANQAIVPKTYKRAVKFLTNYYWFNRESDADGKLPASLGMAVSILKIRDAI